MHPPRHSTLFIAATCCFSTIATAKIEKKKFADATRNLHSSTAGDKRLIFTHGLQCNVLFF